MTTSEFVQKYNNASTGLFKAGQNRGIDSSKQRSLVIDITATYLDQIGLLATVGASGANAYTNSTSISFSSGYVNEMKLYINFAESSTGAVTLNLASVGARKVFISPTVQAGSGDIIAGQEYLIVYLTALDGAAGGFLIIGAPAIVSTGAIDWTFAANSNNFPTSTLKGQLYVAQDDHGNPGDSDYVAAGTWMLSKTAGANSFSGYYMKP